MSQRFPRLLAGMAVVALACTGCRRLPPSKPEAQWTTQERRGAEVFHQNCARCHIPNSMQGRNGPGLQALYKRKYLPSGAPANDDRVADAILRGRGMMPAARLDDAQLSDLLAYLHSL